MGIVAWAEKLNLKFAKLGNPPVYDNRLFPWTAEIEEAAPRIRVELEHVLTRKAELPNFQDIASDVKSDQHRSAAGKHFSFSLSA